MEAGLCGWISKNWANCKDDGHTNVNINKVAYKNDPFIFSQFVRRVFYIDHTRIENWHVVMH